MLRLIAYDIKDARRLRKAARICADYGMRIEYSVFECDLEDEVFQTLLERIRKVLNPTEDRFIAYRICAACERHSIRIGMEKRAGKPRFYII